MMTISVICVYNNESQFQTQLRKSLNAQNIRYELVGINNSESSFSSAAAALNYGVRKATGDILIFSHQDIFLKTENELTELAEAIQSCPIGCIVGTQGVKEPSKLYYENLTAGREYIPQLNRKYEKKLYEVSCIDEGLFGMLRKTWEAHPFDEKLCDNWHLYGVEVCLWARKNGNKVFVYPAHIHHFSMGTISLGYMKNLKLLCKEYRADFQYIWTTCYKVRTNPLYMNSLYALWVLNRFLRGKLR